MSNYLRKIRKQIRNEKKRAKESKDRMIIQTKKMQRLEYAKKNIFESLINSVEQNCPEFVTFNKKAIFEKTDRKMFKKTKDFGKQGYFLMF